MGVPRGGVISPLIANLCMNRFRKYWRRTGKSETWDARIINHADGFVILSRGHAVEALAWTDGVMTRLGSTLNQTKTRLCDAPRTASTSWVIASVHTVIGGKADGSPERLRRKRVCDVSRTNWVRSWYRATKGAETKCAAR